MAIVKPLNQHAIRQSNLKRIYSLVAANEGISRANLAALTGLSKTTVSDLVESLIHQEFLVDDGVSQTNRQGRKPNSLRLNSEGNVIIVINWLPSKLQAACVDLAGNIMNFREQTFNVVQDYAEQISSVYRMLRGGVEAGVNPPRVLAVCIIVPSIIDPVQKRIITSVLPVQSGEWVIRRLRAAIPDIPMGIFNDTACFAYAEAVRHPLDREPSLFVNLSGGVGAVMFSDGQMLRGANGLTTQFGHFSVLRAGPLCRCGNRGCLERRVGESVLTERAREFMPVEQLEAFGALNYRTLGQAADEGVAEFCKLADSMAEDLAYALGNFITLYNVGKCVIGGAGRQLKHYFFQQLQEHLMYHGFREFVRSCELQYSHAPEHAELSGAARYLIDSHYQFEEEQSGTLFLH